MKIKLLSLAIAFILCSCLISCGEDVDATTGIKYTVYENEGTELASFYLTSDLEKDGKFAYSTEELTCVEVYHKTESSEDNAFYETVVFKPISEGEDFITFTLENGGECEYLIKVNKDDNGIMRITVANRKNTLITK